MGKKNNKRPVYLNLIKIRLPIGGVISILHRITGVYLAIILPVFIYFLHRSLRSEVDFVWIKSVLLSPIGKLSILLTVLLLAQHFYSGIRHLLLDIDIGIEKITARASAWSVFLLTLLTTIIMGFYLL